MRDLQWAMGHEIAAGVSRGDLRARTVAEAALKRIALLNPELNAFTAVTGERALAEADAVDAAITAGRQPGPLAGVPFAVKNLFDVEGLPTLAGSRINRDRAAARTDAALIRRLRGAGAVLVGTLGMGEYAYDFTGENSHEGACRNPHDLARMTGGSSSGCGAATAAGLAPVSLGSDTNGSLRVPASLCGVFSLKPTYGRLTRAGTFSFVDSLDHLGPFARSVTDLALSYDAMQGPDPEDHGCAGRPVEAALPGLQTGIEGLRFACPGGWLSAQAGPLARVAAATVAHVLKSEGGRQVHGIDLDGAEAGRAAAYLITNSESAAFHLDRLRARADEFDPDTRDRFLAGALLPAAWVSRAQRVRAWWLARAMEAFVRIDALIVPATPVSAPLRGDKTLYFGGEERPLRPNLGLLAQPFSCIGLPVATVPVFLPGELPIGVQVIVPPWKEALALRIARALEISGVGCARPPVFRDVA
ncbi:AtzE family amidohydrolase [Salipiger mangrovisoli]|uniref:AtzE family amidohydrolase n=1 Tax=Salipiger mangrovisoli TaxID=2865933 RepID=A0ABR9X9H8_9RHOB|nr:AtzE family amidohydrolase [Salipiger mangrovisoli]MBE9640208.1 AtzE family amidohydrolase [Salipiger mangrovisoli]